VVDLRNLELGHGSSPRRGRNPEGRERHAIVDGLIPKGKRLTHAAGHRTLYYWHGRFNDNVGWQIVNAHYTSVYYR